MPFTLAEGAAIMEVPMPLDRRRLRTVTGANSKFFLHVLLLLESFEHHCGGKGSGGIGVCDYGLTAAERTFLERRGALLRAPLALDERHAWYFKATLADYLPFPEDGAVLWLDADALVVDDIVGRLLAIAGDAPERQDVYACLETSCSFGPIFDALARTGKEDVLALYRDFGVRADDPYLSSGIFLTFEPALLTAWRDHVWQVPPHVLFEQNAFNVVRRRFRTGTLDPRLFNVSQEALLDCDWRQTDGAVVTRSGERIAFLHMTANAEGVLTGETVVFSLADGVLRLDDYILRRPENPPIRLLQDAFLSRVLRKYGDELVDLGLARRAPE